VLVLQHRPGHQKQAVELGTRYLAALLILILPYSSASQMIVQGGRVRRTDSMMRLLHHSRVMRWKLILWDRVVLMALLI
jgi:hypothetical protein